MWEVRVFGLATSTSPSTPTTAPTATAPPQITGTAMQGSTLTATAGTWSGAPTTMVFAWRRCDAAGASCAPIPGATSATYVPVLADVGATLRVQVTASNAAGSGVSLSQPTSAVRPASTTSGSLGTSLPPRLGQSTGGQYYVDGQSGSDSNAGTLAAPWRTITKAWNAVPFGSTINVRAGTYSTQTYLSGRSASAANPITIRAYPGETVILRNDSSAGAAVYIDRSSGVRIQGFRITNPSSDGIKVLNSSDIELVSNSVYGNGNQGIIVGGGGSTAPTYSKNVQLWSNRIYSNGALSYTPFQHGVYYGATGSNTDGIQHGAVGGVIANNVFYDQPTGFHIQVGSQVDGVIITNNTFTTASNTSDANLGNAIQFYGEGNQFAPKNVLVVNNAIAFNAHRGVHGAGPSMPSNVVRNNLAYENPMGDFVPVWGSSTVFTLGANMTGADPRFVDRGAKDFHPRADSPLVGRADPAYAPSVDATGAARSGAPDLGALESSG
jgi:Right handed beta helix region/Protein of unknown function (DUF1565)